MLFSSFICLFSSLYTVASTARLMRVTLYTVRSYNRRVLKRRHLVIPNRGVGRVDFGRPSKPEHLAYCTQNNRRRGSSYSATFVRPWNLRAAHQTRRLHVRPRRPSEVSGDPKRVVAPPRETRRRFEKSYAD